MVVLEIGRSIMLENFIVLRVFKNLKTIYFEIENNSQFYILTKNITLTNRKKGLVTRNSIDPINFLFLRAKAEDLRIFTIA